MVSSLLSRRHVVGGLAGLTALVTGITTTTMTDAKKTKGLRIGDITLNDFSDGHFDLPRAAFFDGKGLMPDYVSDPVRIGANVWTVESRDRLVLFGTGSGSHLHARFPETGQLTSETILSPAQREAITDVAVSHMHADHIGGLMKDGKRVFPNARLHIMRQEWEFWATPGRIADVVDAQKGLAQLIASIAEKLDYDLILHDDAVDIAPGVRLVPAPGHTPGHAVLHITSGDDQAMLLGDAILSEAVQFRRPDMRYALDVDPAMASTTRRTLLDALSRDRVPFSATHFQDGRLIRVKSEAERFVSVSG